ncbi:hypothetical protein ACIQ7Q_34410 [Streptomyces sp. NPDC096176]|uniref:hypothetical protein n=1 Tax=Streptomyces sp. NPDC096176 TaxID=3366079 RepID=UPI0038298DE9
MGYLLARMVPLTQRTGWKIEEIIESDIFGLLALAYVAALRTHPPLPKAGPAKELDALAFSYYLRMLASAPRASTTSPTDSSSTASSGAPRPSMWPPRPAPCDSSRTDPRSRPAG